MAQKQPAIVVCFVRACWFVPGPRAKMEPMPAIDAAIGLLTCPVCADALTREHRQLRCGRGHSFDIARQGYVNLLRGPAPANADTAEMVAARERFLFAGYYQPIREAVCSACEPGGRLAEVGVGPGYYLGAAVAATHPPAHLGLDISVAAARRAARRMMACAVADTWQTLPIGSGSLDRLLCIFAPRNPPEFARVLATGGQVVVVAPRPQHLAQLRARLGLLNVEDDKLARLDASFAAAGLELVSRQELTFDIDLDAAATADLVGMGPNAFHDGARDFPRALTTTVAVAISSYESD